MKAYHVEFRSAGTNLMFDWASPVFARTEKEACFIVARARGAVKGPGRPRGRAWVFPPCYPNGQPSAEYYAKIIPVTEVNC